MTKEIKVTKEKMVEILLKQLAPQYRYADFIANKLGVRPSFVSSVLGQLILSGKARKYAGTQRKVYYTYIEDDKMLSKGKKKGAVDSKASKS